MIQWFADPLLRAMAQKGFERWADEGEVSLGIQGPDHIVHIVGNQAIPQFTGLQLCLGLAEDGHLALQLLGAATLRIGESINQAAADRQKEQQNNRQE